MRISDWSSDVCSSDLWIGGPAGEAALLGRLGHSTNLSISTASAAISRAAGLHSSTSETSRPDRAVSAKVTRWPIVVASNGGSWSASVSAVRSEEHTSELQSLMRISYAVFCLKKKKNTKRTK